jgi:hypothetical protein
MYVKSNIQSMVQIKKNIVTKGFSGKLDTIVFRVRGGKTIVSTAPEHKEHELSQAQKNHRKNFQEAILYGKSVLADAGRKAEYKEVADEGQSAYNVAVADFLNAPAIEEIDVNKYTGQPGSTITVQASDDFKVAEVQIAIYNNDGSLVEKGFAVQQPNLADWLYTATAVNSELPGDKVVVRVTDIPGNLTQVDSNL